MDKPLTDAELDSLLAYVAPNAAGLALALIAELRALRADQWDWERVEAAVEINKRVAKLRSDNAKLQADVALALGWDSAEQWTVAMAQIHLGQEAIEQNAKLVTALSELRDYCLSERGGPYVSARRVNEICDTDALASVKGEQG